MKEKERYFTNHIGSKMVIIERKSDWVIFTQKSYEEHIKFPNPYNLDGVTFASKIVYPTFESLAKILD